MADNVTGIVLDIPPTVLENIKNADKAIKDLEQTSKKAAQNIKRDFDTTMVSGVEAFIKKVQEAQTKLGGLKMPKIENVGGAGSGISKTSSEISGLVQALSQLTSALEKNKTARNALKSASIQDTEYSRVSAELAKQAERYIQLSLAIEQFNKKKFEETSLKERQTNTSNVQELQALQQTIPLLRQKVELMERNMRAAQAANNPTLQTRKAQEELAAMNKMYAEEEKASAKKAAQLEKDRQREAAAAQKAYEQQQKLYDKLFGKGGLADKQVQQALAQQKATTLASPTGAIDYAKNARSLKDLTAAYQNLKKVMATTDPKSSQWQQMNAVLGQTRTRIDEIKKKMGEFKSHASQVGDVAGQLKRTLAAAFSISAITGYINKLIETRAQFELQQTALRAILQDKQEADKIFQQVQQMALQSPFSIMQMTTFTKQLAAYRIEADKLVGTTKMLADVSAGLGVDMQRLILAYGQVKAANYLRACLGKGTKVKMFDGTFKNVEDVVVGDVLMGDDEQPRNVSKLYQGEQQMYRVSYSGGGFRCNEHHILTVYDALKMRVSDVFVLDYLAEPHRYRGVRRVDGAYKIFVMKVERDTVDTYYGFSIDGNHRFIIEDNVVTHNTEVRQFTEAGLNIAGELATYFSELQGKMISVGDVMEMITKRMVRFEDVEEVFKRVTSAGGLFYDMQKKQSETLWGQLQRIKDAMSIMFNEIGKSNQGVISWFLKAIRELINSWRTLAPIINIAGAALVTYMVAGKAIPAMVAGLKALKASWIAVTAATKAADAAGKAAAASNPYGILATAAAALLMTIYQLVTAQSALNEEFDRISEESSKDMWDLIFKFQEGADAVRDTTKSYEERQKALEDLQNTFRGILPDQDLEYNNIIRITDGYKSATEAIKAYSAEKAKQAAEEAINTEKQKMYNDLMDEAKELAPHVKGAFDSLTTASDAAVKGMIGNVMLQIQQETEKGMIKSAEQGYNRFIEIMTQRFGNMNNSALATGLQNGLKSVFGVGLFDKPSGDFEEYLTFMTDKQQEFAEQFQTTYEGMTQQDIDNFANYKKTYEERAKVLGDFQAKLLAYQEARKNGDIDAQGNATNEAGQGRIADLEEVINKINNFTGLSNEAKISWDKLRESTNYETDALIYFDSVQKTVLGSFLQNIINAGGNKSIVNWAEETNKSLRNAGFQEMQLDIANTAKKWGLLSGVSSAVMNKIKIDANTNYSSAAKDAKALSDEAQENILKITQTTLALIEMGRKSGQIISHAQAQADAEKMWGTTIEDEKKIIAWASELAKLWGNVDKTASKAAKSTKKANKAHGGSKKDIWTPRLELIKKINTEYEKLLKYYSKEEAMARIRKSYGDAVAAKFGKTAWGDISKWDGFDDEATIKRLKAVGAKSGKEYKAKFLEAAGTIQAEIDIKIEEKKIQEAKDKIQSLFDNYELTKTLGGLGLNIDLTYLVGGKPVKLEDLRKQLEQELSTVKATGGEEDTVKAYENALRKVTDLENKAAQERLKNYNKYLLESVGERARIELKAQQEISKIKQNIDLDEFSKTQAIKEATQKKNDDLAKFDFDQLKASDIYIQVFKDMERASKNQLQYVIDHLRELQKTYKDLSPTQVKAIATALKEAEASMAKMSSLKDFGKNFKTAIEYAKNQNKLKERQATLEGNLFELREIEAEQQVAYVQEAEKLETIQDKTSAEYTKQSTAVVEAKLAWVATQRIIEDLLKELKIITGEIDNGEGATGDLIETWNNIEKIINEVSSLLGDIGEGLDAMGLGSDALSDGISSAQAVISGATQAGRGAVQAFTDPSPWGKVQGAIQAVGGVIKMVGSLFAIGDKKKERQIKRLQEKVENLQKAYEKLQTAIEEAYAFDDYNAGYNQSMKNLQEQREAIQEQLALEKSKKKSDKDKIREYEDALDELAEKEKELREARYEAMGSVGESGVRTEAENFVSAWLDAYKETGDGLDALKDHWDEFFENLVLKQASSAVVSRRMKKYVDQINAAIDSGDTGLSLSQTFAQIGQNLKNELGTWNEDLKAFFDAVGIKGGQGELLLSDLQKGIQNITEPQAAAIEAYLNSMRFAVFEQNNILTEMLSAIQAQYGSNDNSPMLQEVRAIRSLVASIDDRLSRVIVQRSSVNTGYAVMVK